MHVDEASPVLGGARAGTALHGDDSAEAAAAMRGTLDMEVRVPSPSLLL